MALRRWVGSASASIGWSCCSLAPTSERPFFSRWYDRSSRSMSTRPPTDITVRPAHTSDVKAIRAFIDAYAPSRMLLNKPTVTLYEDVQEFWVAERAEPGGSASVVGCGALHVMWEDLAEVRTLAVDPAQRGHGIGHLLL